MEKRIKRKRRFG